jgi:hypothetical protein
MWVFNVYIILYKNFILKLNFLIPNKINETTERRYISNNFNLYLKGSLRVITYKFLSCKYLFTNTLLIKERRIK